MLRKFFDTLSSSEQVPDGESKIPHVRKSPSLFETEMGKLVLVIDQEIWEAAGPVSHVGLKAPDSETFKAFGKDPERAAEPARFIFKHRAQIMTTRHGRYTSWMTSTKRGFATFVALMRSTLPLPPEELLDWMAEIKRDCDKPTGPIRKLSDWPIAFMTQMIERKAKKEALSDAAFAQLRAMLSWPEMSQDAHYGRDFSKIKLRIEKRVGEAEGVEQVISSSKKLSGDTFGDALQEKLDTTLAAQEAMKWHRTFHLAASASGGKPTKSFLEQAKSLKDDLGNEWVRSHMQAWLEQGFTAPKAEKEHTTMYGRRRHTWTSNIFFTKSNGVLLKGLVWIAKGYKDSKTVNLVADLCEKSMKKIPGVGPAAQVTANACLWYLEVTPGTQAIAPQSRMWTAIKPKKCADKSVGHRRGQSRGSRDHNTPARRVRGANRRPQAPSVQC